MAGKKDPGKAVLDKLTEVLTAATKTPPERMTPAELVDAVIADVAAETADHDALAAALAERAGGVVMDGDAIDRAETIALIEHNARLKRAGQPMWSDAKWHGKPIKPLSKITEAPIFYDPAYAAAGMKAVALDASGCNPATQAVYPVGDKALMRKIAFVMSRVVMLDLDGVRSVQVNPKSAKAIAGVVEACKGKRTPAEYVEEALEDYARLEADDDPTSEIAEAWRLLTTGGARPFVRDDQPAPLAPVATTNGAPQSPSRANANTNSGQLPVVALIASQKDMAGEDAFRRALFRVADVRSAASVKGGYDIETGWANIFQQAAIVCVLVSHDCFVDCDGRIDQALAMGKRVVPILYRVTNWQDGALGPFQAIPRDGFIKTPGNDEAWAIVGRDLRAVLAATVQPAPTPTTPTPTVSLPSGSLSGDQIRAFVEALLSAFPTPSGLSQMVRFNMNESIDAIAGGSNHRDVVFNLVSWAEQTGKIAALLAAARKGNPGNPALAALTLAAPSAVDPYDALCSMLPAQFDEVTFRLRVPTAHMSPSTVPQGVRAREVIQWAQSTGKTVDLTTVIARAMR